MPRKPKKEKSTQNCDATLVIKGRRYEGHTGKSCGHAEMHALHLYIDDTVERYAEKHHIYRFKDILPEVARKLIASHPKVVFCPSRPVCIQCGTVLQKLGFTTGTKTVWGTETMGSTEWGVSLRVRDLLKECEIDYDAIKRLRR